MEREKTHAYSCTNKASFYYETPTKVCANKHMCAVLWVRYPCPYAEGQGFKSMRS